MCSEGEGQRPCLGRPRLTPEWATERKRRGEESAEAVVATSPPEATRRAPGREGPNGEEIETTVSLEGAHQGLDNELIVSRKATNGVGRGDRRERLGGILSFYYRRAA
jgi:hypothetical protein